MIVAAGLGAMEEGSGRCRRDNGSGATTRTSRPASVSSALVPAFPPLPAAIRLWLSHCCLEHHLVPSLRASERGGSGDAAQPAKSAAAIPWQRQPGATPLPTPRAGRSLRRRGGAWPTRRSWGWARCSRQVRPFLPLPPTPPLSIPARAAPVRGPPPCLDKD